METGYIVLGVYNAIIVCLVLYTFRKEIGARIYGRRWKRYIEIDTGKTGFCVLSKNLDSTRIDGITKAVNWKNIHYGVIYFENNLAENVKIEYANEKAEYYMNSNEFNTIMHNNVLEKLLITQSERLIMIILILVTVVLAGVIYLGYTLHGMQGVIEYIAGKISEAGVTHGN